MTPEDLAELGQQLRVDAIRCTATAGSGHATSALSAADLAAVLMANHLRYDFDNPEHPGNDRLILSKGHASPLLYAMYAAAGVIDEDELLTYRDADSRLEGHPTPRLPWVDVATGSLGQGLPIGVGMALTARHLDRIGYRVWVLCGDSELAEGSMWEAVEHAGHTGLGNLTAIVDVNRLGQRGPTRHGWDTDAYERRFGAFGWYAITVDGHAVDQIDDALAEAGNADRPTVILARTRKGDGVSAVSDREGAHGKPLADPGDAIAELGGRRSIHVDVSPPEQVEPPEIGDVRPLQLPRYEAGDEVATRTAFGEALAALGNARPDVVALDAEVSDSTRIGLFEKGHTERFFEFYIAEQQMIAAAVGMQALGWNPYAATFAAFLTRAHDFIRMAAVSGADLRLVGSHAGVSIGEDGPSQMGLEDMAMFRALWRSTVLYPCDANQTAHLVATMSDHPGICYLRTTRGETPVIYGSDESFPVGGSRVLRSSPDDEVTVIAAGITVHEALSAADLLSEEGITARVVDLYSVKPVDADTVRHAADETRRIVTVEDHWPRGGLGDAVLDVLSGDRAAVTKLGVAIMPGSAKPAEQLHAAGIDAAAIADAARSLVRG